VVAVTVAAIAVAVAAALLAAPLRRPFRGCVFVSWFDAGKAMQGR